jgi:hypothetical protein
MWNPSRGVYPQTNPVGLQLNERARKLLAGKKVADAFDYIAYDTLRFKPGAATPTQELLLFTNGFGQSVTVANAPTESYIKPRQDTNLQDGNRLPSGQFFIVDSIQIMIEFTGSTDTTYPTSGVGTEEPTDTTAAAAISSVNLITAVLRQGIITFVVGEKEYEQGPLYQFPSDFGVSGFAGSGSSSSATVNNILSTEVAVNNGFGRARILAIQREIPPLVNFYVRLQFFQALVISRQFSLRCLLRGILYRPVQ